MMNAMKTDDTIIVWSYGGGTQTAAIAALVLMDELPKPDIVIMADTGYEVTETFTYLNNVINPALSKIGLSVTIIGQEWASHGLIKSDRILIPAYTTKNGRVGKLPTFCSNEWKQRPIRRWLRAQGVKQADLWLGISMDELERMRPSGLKWLVNKYPLIEMRPTYRYECYTLVGKMGWPKPPKSRCWMCPNMSPLNWRELKKRYPEDFAKAVKFENELQKRDEHMFLHSAAKPLREAVEENEQQQFLFDGCDSGFCFV